MQSQGNWVSSPNESLALMQALRHQLHDRRNTNGRIEK